MNQPAPADLDRLIFALFDEAITPQNHRLLQDALLASKPARDRYLELCALHNLLELVGQAPMVVTMPRPLSVKGRENQPLPRRPFHAKARPLPAKRSHARQTRRGMRRVTSRVVGKVIRNRPLLATAAVLVLVVIFLGWKLVPTQPMAKLAYSRGSEFTISHPKDFKKKPNENSLDPGTSIELTQGTVGLTFSSGVRGVFQAPETITLTDEQHLTVKRGTAWFHVPPKAVGFEVLTPELKIVDLGTEFGVVSRPDGADEIHVLSGKVETTVRSGMTARETLVAGESRVVSPGGGLAKIDTKQDLFLTEIPATLPYLHWSFDETDLNRLATDGSHPAAGHVANKVVATHGGPVFASVPGKFGQALSSLGKNGYLESDWSGIGGSAPRTVACWIKLPPGQNLYHPLVGWGDRGKIRSFFSYLKTQPGGTIAAVSCDTFWLEGSIPVDDNQWHHHAVVYTGRAMPGGDPEIFCYVDGNLDRMTRYDLGQRTTRDPSGNIIVSTITNGPGAVPLNLFTNMGSDRKTPGTAIILAIDELYVFQSALSAPQIANLYRSNQYDPSLVPTKNTR